jgi:hypothetical protein
VRIRGAYALRHCMQRDLCQDGSLLREGGQLGTSAGHQRPVPLGSTQGVETRLLGGVPHEEFLAHFSAYGLIGVPTALVTGKGGATSRKA